MDIALLIFFTIIMAIKPLVIGSYNCKHFNEDSLIYIRNLFDTMSCDVLLLQEHCLFNYEFGSLSNIGDVSFQACSAMNEHETLIGRPHGGCAVIWKNDMNCQVEGLDCDNTRVCPVIVTFNGNYKLLIINVYFPCDDYYASQKFDTLVETLNAVSSILCDAEYDDVILAGDLNADFKRTTPHVNAIKEMLSAWELKCGISHNKAKVSHTFESKGNGSRSLIDHYCVTDNLFENITKYDTFCSVDNFSDHLALICTFNVDVSKMERTNQTFRQRAAWYKASESQIMDFTKLCDNILQGIRLPNHAIHCDNPRCENHRQDIEDFYSDIVTACLGAEKECIPKTGPGRKKRIPGWTEHVSAQRLEALHHHDLWKNAGRPLEGVLAENRRYYRRQYHNAIRYCRKERETIVVSKIAKAFTQNSNRQFWKEIQKIKSDRNRVSRIVDGESDHKEIANIFHSQFKDLYSSVPYKDEDMEILKKKMDDLIELDYESLQKNNTFMTPGVILECIKKLKAGKFDGTKGFTSDCIINGPWRLCVCLSMLFRMMLTHGYCPEELILGTMTPIPKVKTVANQSSKYRAITLNSSIGKLFDLVVLAEYSKLMDTNDLQFGFKKACSTTMCTTMLKEVASHYVNNGSQVYCVFLDASKAFDRVEYTRLFNVLLERKLNAVYARCLLFMYTKQQLRVQWQGILSDSFSVMNGVKQGGIMSPTLFSIYMDKLLERLEATNAGCYVGPHFARSFAYADVCVLMAPCIKGLEQLLKVCEKFSDGYMVKFNASKSQFIIFHGINKKPMDTGVVFSGSKLDIQYHAIHLGHKFRWAS